VGFISIVYMLCKGRELVIVYVQVSVYWMYAVGGFCSKNACDVKFSVPFCRGDDARHVVDGLYAFIVY
jgi:hypothetical protein